MRAIDIARLGDPVDLSTTGGELVARFEREPELHIVAVVEDQRPVGLVTRQDLLQHFSHKFGRELWDRRSIANLLRAEPRTIAGNTSLEEFCKAMAEITPEQLLEGVAFIDAQGRYEGAASAFDIYQASVLVTEAKNRELVEIAGQLKAETEKARAASEAKSNFLATMSHEIRTPLNGVLGMAQALALDELAPSQRHKVDVIVSSGETLTALLNDILDLSKIDANKLDIAEIDADLHATILRVKDLFEPVARDKGLSLSVMIEGDVPARLRFDPVRVHQCLANLVSNAVKFTQHGEVAITCNLSRWNGKGGYLISLAIRDTGIGMSAETLASLFTPFTQADGSIARKFGGTGLGLAISRRLARLMGGTVEVESVNGEGSTFHLTFEASEAAPDQTVPALQARIEELAGGSPTRTPPRILLVDDNSINRQVVRLFLATIQSHVVEAVNGIEALERLASQPFDLVLLDIHMPVMDGCEAIRHIRASDAAWRSIPVIALTADAMEGDREKFVAMGMDDYVAKPVDRRLLLSSIASQLSEGGQCTARAATAA